MMMMLTMRIRVNAAVVCVPVMMVMKVVVFDPAMMMMMERKVT